MFKPGVLGAVLLQAANVRGELNTIMADYALPIVIIVFVIGSAIGLIKNMDKIIDSNNEGTRREGLVNTVYYPAFAVLFVIIIGAIITLLNSKLSFAI